jgi:hypothetical protein
MSTVASENEDAQMAGKEGWLIARVVHYETGDELTLFPPGASGVDLMTRWITAVEGAWVDPEEMR